MKRIVLYILILIVVCALPVQKQDVATLEPVQAVWMDVQQEQVVLITDTGDQGGGKTVTEALVDMKAKSSGMIYLDTAQYLLVTEQGKAHIPQLAIYLKDDVRICQWEGQGEMEDAAQYIRARKLGMRLGRWQENAVIPSVPSLKEK